MDLCLLFQFDTSMEKMVEELVALATHDGLFIIPLFINSLISIHQALFQLARNFLSGDGYFCSFSQVARVLKVNEKCIPHP